MIRLTTDAPLSLIDGEAPFVLTRPLHMVFGPDEPFTGDLQKTCREFAERTHDYWMEWVRRLSISYDWQEAIIRAAITLKLSNFDETGGLVAAHTTSIPELPASGRTWDYRYCWLRDAYFVVQALNRIGATRTMEEFISFTISIASKPDQELKPLYSVVPTSTVEERIAPDLEGYRGDGPVRIGNAAVDQVQNDTYGSVILAAMPMFFDRRLPRPGDEGLFHLLELLGSRAAQKAFEPDAGIWEYRGRQRVHTHSAAMCWAGCQRLAAIATRLGLEDRAKHWNAIAEPMHATLLEHAWNQKRGAFTAAFGSDDLDASVLLLAHLGVVEVDDPRFVSTVAAMERELVREKHVMRYASADDFGLPVTAFLICRFWLIDALWSLRAARSGARLFTDALSIATATACFRKTSIRRPARCGAISRRPIRWRDSFSPPCGCRGAGKTVIGAAERAWRDRRAFSPARSRAAFPRRHAPAWPFGRRAAHSVAAVRMLEGFRERLQESLDGRARRLIPALNDFDFTRDFGIDDQCRLEQRIAQH